MRKSESIDGRSISRRNVEISSTGAPFAKRRGQRPSRTSDSSSLDLSQRNSASHTTGPDSSSRKLAAMSCMIWSFAIGTGNPSLATATSAIWLGVSMVIQAKLVLAKVGLRSLPQLFRPWLLLPQSRHDVVPLSKGKLQACRAELSALRMHGRS